MDKNMHLTKSLFTVPNIISIARILLIVPSSYFIMRDNYILAVLFLVISGISDMLDGIIARKLNQITVLGQILDPVADKLTLVVVAICISAKFPELIPIVLVLVTKDILMLGFGMSLLYNKITPMPAKWYGKVATVLFYFSIILTIGMKAMWKYSSSALNWFLFAITASMMIFAMISYFVDYLKLLKSVEDKE